MRFDMTAAPVLLTVAVTAAAPVECAVAHVRHTRADKGSCHLPRAYAALQQIMSLGDVKGMGTWNGCFGGLSFGETEMPSERPYPGQLWKHDSAHVIVVAVHPNTVTYEFLSGGQSVTQSLDVFLAAFRRLRR